MCAAFPRNASAQSQDQATPPPGAQTRADLVGAVIDSMNGQPIQSAEIDVTRDHGLVARATSDEFGKYVIHQIPPGAYVVQVRLIGYHMATSPITIRPGQGAVRADFLMAVLPLTLERVNVTAKAPVAVDTRTGNQVFQENDYHGSPTTVSSQLLQQSIAGAARAPTGEVHIRGQHAEYTYYVDGVPVLPGISGSLNELFDPAIVGRAEFVTGGWDAEYGNKNTAIINITTQVPPGGFHSELSGFGGSYVTNGQSLQLSDTRGKWGWFITGSRDRTDMRQEPVLADPNTGKAINFHNDGDDVSGFGKVQYLSSAKDAVTLDANWSRT
jgi:hypothetical protein